MAIFYEHIKGLSTGNASDSIFQFLKWQTIPTQSTDSKTQSQIPEFWERNTTTSANNYGHLVVSGDVEQPLEGLLKLNKKQLSIKSPNGNYWWLQTDYNDFLNKLTLRYVDGGDNPRLFSANTDGYFDIPNACAGYDMRFGYASGYESRIWKEDGTNNYWSCWLSGNIYLGVSGSTTDKIYRDGNNYSLKLSGKAEITDHVQATYFNASSDKRLKTNINPLPSTLDFVCKTPLYSFNYTTNNLPSIGVVAQDIQDAQFGNFKPVVTPRNEKDFLSVHESKFVYILWKAIQEQQEEIEALKAEIAELKKTEN